MHTHPEIVQGFADLFSDSEKVLQSIENPTAKPADGSWSPLEELQHLVLSARMVASGLKQPKMMFKMLGKPNRPVRTYQETQARYNERLAGVAPGTTNPVGPKPGETMEGMLIQWAEIGEKFASRLHKWDEGELDSNLMPHPLMGKIMVREMLFFTHFHTVHHLDKIKAKAGV